MDVVELVLGRGLRPDVRLLDEVVDIFSELRRRWDDGGLV